MNLLLRSLFFLMGALLLGIFAGKTILTAYWQDEDQVYYSESTLISIGESETLSTAMVSINQYATNSHPLLDRIVLRLYGKNVLIKTGEYEVNGYYSRVQLFDLLGSGLSKQYPITLIEGSTFKEIVRSLEDSENLKGFTIDTAEFEFLDNAEVARLGGERNPEGWLLPETYYFSSQSTFQDVLRRSHHAMLDRLQREWEARAKDLPLDSPYEALILASIIEKESGHIDEREKIAGVFVRRLQKGMRLQTDPTVIYGMGDSYKGNITRRDLKRDTPYNTYTRFGLPPTPIAMPGLASIKAALHPAEGSSLYFVAKGDGSHVFSDTLEEHNRAVREYQILRRRADYQSAPQRN